MAAGHYPVLLDESVEALVASGVSEPFYIDATFGGGGHSERILQKLPPGGRVLAIDRDPQAAERASGLLQDRRFSFAAGAFDAVLSTVEGDGDFVDGILFDLGLSSFQIDEPDRGFSYVNDGPLDMRMNPTEGESAADFLNSSDATEIADVLKRFGGVLGRDARRISEGIVRSRPLRSTSDLTDTVRDVLGWAPRGGNPAKRVFQAIRVFINDELGSLSRALATSERLLKPDGRLVVITFQSGEDRIVKRFISDREGKCVCPPELPVCVCGAKASLRRGPVMKPSRTEVEENPRSASARMRVGIRTQEPPHSEDSHDGDDI